MSKAVLVADAHDAVKKAVANCNDKAKALLGEVSAYTSKSAEKILGAEPHRMTKLAIELMQSHSDLQDATHELDALRRQG
ncbi:MAG: hypothetical protein KF841_14220 [Phycisphaerae bacterium]|nr:hypothetical protein [Phycisphaerae bacterium]